MNKNRKLYDDVKSFFDKRQARGIEEQERAAKVANASATGSEVDGMNAVASSWNKLGLHLENTYDEARENFTTEAAMAAFEARPPEPLRPIKQLSIITSTGPGGERKKGEVIVEHVGGNPRPADDAGEEDESAE
ncbi:hypothetical protein DOTSEDRAFT_77426 [Dothistroma septosporum NZE10]|uniref:Uncharacterized protein n=1 Tax=Dothistroma septosporum (strain NZE10 / CBS 128990) TaxID=675120 RepID=N1PX17_DOTSN|nr:hypothetical protein DOTSEDRAFT_77426 [Dothistroma septosporum NZE10]